jgi:protein TonB
VQEPVLTATIEPLTPEAPTAPPVPEPQLEPAPVVEPEPPPAVSAAQILASRSLEIARLSARIEETSSAYAHRPRRKAISASTREYKYAAYLEAWRRKVEQIGNLNYPEEAKKHKLYGNLILHVAVRSDGSLESVRVLRSSGFDVLDQAAVNIVKLAAPFSPFPSNISSDTDVLDITRTWQFLSSNRLGWEN